MTLLEMIILSRNANLIGNELELFFGASLADNLYLMDKIDKSKIPECVVSAIRTKKPNVAKNLTWNAAFIHEVGFYAAL